MFAALSSRSTSRHMVAKMMILIATICEVYGGKEGSRTAVDA